MNSVERQWKQLLESAKNVTIKEVHRKKKRTIRYPWFTAECQTMIDKRRVIKLKWLASKMLTKKKANKDQNSSKKIIMRQIELQNYCSEGLKEVS